MAPRSPWTMLLFGLLTLVSLAYGPRARAEQIWLVTEVRTGGDQSAPAGTTERVEQLLREREQNVLDNSAAAAEIERNHSRPPVRMQPEQLEQLDAALRTLADHLASENLAEARTALEGVERLTPDARDYLNRQLTRARRRFHTCLLAAHLFAKEGYDDDAFQQVRRCASDFPGLEPEEGPYLPESIRAFFARARQELQSIRPALLHIDVVGGGGSRCRARVNGIDKGALPATIADIRADEVRVQVDCDKRVGRIYAHRVEPGDNVLRIDPRLDRALETQSALLLHYADGVSARDQRVEHSARLGLAVNATQVIQVMADRVYRIDVESKEEIASAPIDSSASASSLSSAIAELLEAEAPSGEPAPDAAVAKDSSTRSNAAFAPLAWVSVGLAGVAAVTTVIAWQVRESAADDFNREDCVDSDDPERPTRAETCGNALDTVDSAETAMVVSGITAGAFLGMATVFFVLDATTGGSAEPSASTCGNGPGELGVQCRWAF